jgi:hypothetical protein
LREERFMRIVLGGFFLLHGVLHLLGFAEAFGLVDLPQLTGETLIHLGPAWQQPIGVLWLLAAVVLVGAGAQLLARNAGWWMVGVCGLALSQLLICYAWHDAKAGTLINLALGFGVIVGWGPSRFARETAAEVRTLLSGVASAPADQVTDDELASLPAPVARWLRRAGVVGRPRVRTMVLRQRGQLRAAIDEPFFPAHAEQHINLESPGFVWAVDTMMKHLPVTGRDAYLRGHGRMLVSVGGLSTVVDATGPSIDHDTLLRFLGELVWCPSAALAPYVQWHAIEPAAEATATAEAAAEATMSYRGITASARFTFDAEGRVTTVSARRYLGSGTAARLETWVVKATQWQLRHGVEIPSHGSVAWLLGGERFETYRWEITKLEYDMRPRASTAAETRRVWPAWTAVAMSIPRR